LSDAANEPTVEPFGGLPDLPALAELKSRPRWVAWRYEVRNGRATKPPVNPHTGGNASTAKAATWGSYEEASQYTRANGLPGVGYVLGEDDGDLTGIDLDKCINGATDQWALDVLALNETYAEVSPSGTGIRIIARGKIDKTFKFDPAGVEVYGSDRYLTITGNHIAGTPTDIRPATQTVAALRQRVEDKRKEVEGAKRKATNGAGQEQPEQPQERPKRKHGVLWGAIYGNEHNPFFRNVNSAALQSLFAWVPALFSPAKANDTGGYRVSSADLGRELQEDLSLTPQGIKDWGVWDIGDANEGKRTPIDVVLEYGSQNTAADAALWLCERLAIDPASLGWRDRQSNEGGPAHDADEKARVIPWLDMSRWDHEPIPKRQWSILDRVPLNQAGLFSGEGGTGKSILELTKDVAHVAGKDWLGSLPEVGPAFYIGAEDDKDELHIRLAAIAKRYSVTFEELIAGGLHVLCLLGQDATLCAAGGKSGRVEVTDLYRQLYEAAGDIKPKNISIDTLSRAFAGNEIDRVQVYAFAMYMQALAMVAGGSVTVLSHPSLQGIASGSGISGSTAWHGAFRFRQYLKGIKPDNGEQPAGDLRELEFKKNQYGPIGESVVVRYQDGLFLPVPGVGSLERMAQEQGDEEMFLALLDQFDAQGRAVNDKRMAPNYAPTMFSQDPRANGTPKTRFAAAMNRLFAANKIHVRTYGRPSRPNSKIARGARP
jgi:RecA-family ATPase